VIISFSRKTLLYGVKLVGWLVGFFVGSFETEGIMKHVAGL